MAGAWEPKYPLTAAESFVNWPLHRDHIVNQRARLERFALPSAKRIALAIGDFRLPTNRLTARLEEELYIGLERTVRFGYREAQREIRAQRKTGVQVLPESSAVRLGATRKGVPHLDPEPLTARYY